MDSNFIYSYRYKCTGTDTDTDTDSQIHRYKQARHNLIKVVAVVVLILSGCQAIELEPSSIIEPFDFFSTSTNLLPKQHKRKIIKLLYIFYIYICIYIYK